MVLTERQVAVVCVCVMFVVAVVVLVVGRARGGVD